MDEIRAGFSGCFVISLNISHISRMQQRVLFCHVTDVSVLWQPGVAVAHMIPEIFVQTGDFIEAFNISF